jgi:hypothetical protein
MRKILYIAVLWHMEGRLFCEVLPRLPCGSHNFVQPETRLPASLRSNAVDDRNNRSGIPWTTRVHRRFDAGTRYRYETRHHVSNTGTNASTDIEDAVVRLILERVKHRKMGLRNVYDVDVIANTCTVGRIVIVTENCR